VRTFLRSLPASPPPVAGPVTFQDETWWITPSDDGAFHVLNPVELREAVRRAEMSVANSQPAWAAASVRHGMFELAATAHDGQVLASVNEPLAVTVLLASPDILFRSWTKQIWWAVGLLGSAVGAAALGLVLTRRAFLRERRLGEFKSQFVSSVSHELRAPIASLRLMADALESGKVTGPAAHDFFRLMAAEGARLSALIENVLDFARIEQGRRRYALAETDVAALISEAVRLLEPQAAARKIQLVFEAAPLPFIPRVDAPALRQAVVNLLDNAIKFSPENSTVAVKVAPQPSARGWRISVVDQGPGIPSAEHARIFERFCRLGNELRRETQGAGIGLSLVKHIVEGHSGRVELHSAPGHGSNFSLVFPNIDSDFTPSPAEDESLCFPVSEVTGTN
jgi:signal transduction histidine kinase